jgi:hypothetical protein
MTHHLLTNHRDRGARALVLLHETQLREFLGVWRLAKAANVTLPQTTDPSYASLETLLFHVLRAARGYMTWTCERLGLGDPAIAEPPALETIEHQADAYIEHVIDRWRVALVDATGEQLEQVHTSRWGVPYCVDSMLEHAVVHPMRHSFQLRELIEAARGR